MQVSFKVTHLLQNALVDFIVGKFQHLILTIGEIVLLAHMHQNIEKGLRLHVDADSYVNAYSYTYEK